MRKAYVSDWTKLFDKEYEFCLLILFQAVCFLLFSQNSQMLTSFTIEKFEKNKQNKSPLGVLIWRCSKSNDHRKRRASRSDSRRIKTSLIRLKVKDENSVKINKKQGKKHKQDVKQPIEIDRTYTGPLTLRMIDRFDEVSIISTRTCVHCPWLPVRPRIFTTRAITPPVAVLSMISDRCLFVDE